MFKINRLSGFVFFTRLTVGISHLREHKFKHRGYYSCRTNAVENTEHYILHCSNFANQRAVMFDDLWDIGINYGPLDSSTLPWRLLFGNSKFSDNVNSRIIYAVIAFAWNAWRFAIGCALLLPVLVFLPALSGISGNSEQKIILQTIEQLIQFNYLFLFRVYSFSGQVAAKGNSLEATW